MIDTQKGALQNELQRAFCCKPLPAQDIEGRLCDLHKSKNQKENILEKLIKNA